MVIIYNAGSKWIKSVFVSLVYFAFTHTNKQESIRIAAAKKYPGNLVVMIQNGSEGADDKEN